MYGDNPTAVLPPVVAGTSVAVLPATGADFLMSAALAVAAGLATWGVVYFVTKVRR